MKYLYKYLVVVDGKKIEAVIRKFEILKETEKQWIYKCFDRYYIQDKVDVFGKGNISGCYVDRNMFTAYLYTTSPSEDCENEVRKLINKELKSHFAFVEKLKELEITFKEESYE